MDKEDVGDIYIYNGILLSQEKEGNLAVCNTWMNLEDTMLSAISQAEKENYCTMSLICGL